MSSLKIGLVGIGGFGQVLLKYISRLQQEKRLILEAACDIQLDKHIVNIRQEPFSEIRTYREYEAFLNAEQQLDAIIIATPIPLHVEMGIRAMESGFNVMLEKPPALTFQDIDRMIEVHRRTGKIFGVGFQHTSETSFIKFCEEIKQGRIGKIRAITATGLWKRTHGYFTRSPWVGKLMVEGRYVLDGTINNPFSHLLMNCLVLAGLESGAEVLPLSVQAELYRANAIEGEDTSCLRAVMDNGLEIFFCTSICARENAIPCIKVYGDEGWVCWDYDGWIRYGKAGAVTCQDEFKIDCDRRYDHLLNFVQYLRQETPHLSCSLEATRKFVLTANLAFESAGLSIPVAGRFVEMKNASGQPIDELKAADDYLCIKGIEQILEQSFTSRKMFSELEVEWAEKRNPVFAAGYQGFKLFR